MLGSFRRFSRYKPASQATNPMYNFKWYEPGENNPFNKRILDIRPYTQHMVSFTKDSRIAERFIANRKVTGEEYKGFEFKNAVAINTTLTYTHNGKKPEGIGYKAKLMEDKWDIYVWDDIIYFVRSWTGDVSYKAYISCSDGNLTIYKIEFENLSNTEGEASVAVNNVHFLISTLAYKAILPHKIPVHLKTNEEIAAYSFGAFGRNCWYATYDEVTDTEVTLSGK